jgi:hypothetical protein
LFLYVEENKDAEHLNYLVSKNEILFKNYSSEALIRIDHVDLPFINQKKAVKDRLIKNNFVYLKDIAMLYSILDLTDLEIQNNLTWSDSEKGATFLLF